MTTTWTEGYRPDKKDLQGLYQYRFETAGGLVMDCFLEHTPATEATDVCPGNSERLELIWALVGGIDISEVIGDAKDTIEEEALERMTDEARAANDEPREKDRALAHYGEQARLAVALMGGAA